MIERAAALDPSRSFIVQAPAGSGKTELLMQRYLVLLSMVSRPEEILALTFTRKAAGEMQHRIVGALLKARDGHTPQSPHEEKTVKLAGKVLERDRAANWGLIENPGRLKIQTIDAFCSSIIRQAPLTSGLGRTPAVTENPGELYEEAARRTIALVEEETPEGESVRKALKHLDNSTGSLVERLVFMLGRRDQWLRHVDHGMDEARLKASLEASISGLVEDCLQKIINAFQPDTVSTVVPLSRYAAHNVQEGARNGNIKYLSSLEGLPGACAEELPKWRGLRELLLTSANTWRKQWDMNSGFPPGKEGKPRKDEMKEAVDAVRENGKLLEKLASISILPDPSYSEEEWDILGALLLLLPVACAKLAEVFAEEGVTDFQAISMAAITALGTDDDPTDLMLALDWKIQHILVDEYQDTSHTQLRLLKSLTRGWTEGDGRTLFVVGDPMQSIYLFREAEVGLFLEAREKGIGPINLTPLTLSCNFRSQQAIVDWVNGSFQEAFPFEEDSFRGCIRYSPSSAVKPPEDGGVEIYLTERKDEDWEAGKVISIIKSIPPDESAAVLCRSRGHLANIISLLKGQGIPYRAQEMDPLAGKPVAQDLLSLLRALAHPFDRVAWLSILRAPWCGLGLKDLHALCEGDGDSPMIKLLEDSARLANLSEEGRQRLVPFTAKLKAALKLNGRVAPRELLEGLWTSIGGPACFADGPSIKDAGVFFDLVSKSTAAGSIDPLVSIEERMDGLMSPESGSLTANLQLMTIHKAKGLEFDHVIIPGAGKRTRPEQEKLLMWMERGDDLFLAPAKRKTEKGRGPVYGFLRETKCEKIESEKARIFYVAATRARKRLHILGDIKRDDTGSLLSEDRSFLSSIFRVLRDDMIINKAPEAPGAQDAGPAPVLELKRLPLSWQPPPPAEGILLEKPIEKVRDTEAEPVFYWAGAGVRHLGTVVHRYLCRIAREGLKKWAAPRVKGERERMEGMLRALGLARKDAANMASDAIGIIEGALEDKLGRWILGEHEDASVELPLTGVLKGEIIDAVIDRTFVDDGVRWIIDYKASRHEGGSTEEFLKNEKRRYMPQLEKYAALMRAGGEQRPIKNGIYYPALGELIEW